MPFPGNLVGSDGTTINASQIASNASNLRIGDNPSYAVADFVSMYPSFGPDADENYVVPMSILQVYIDLASASVQEARYHGAWSLCMGLFVAHFATLWLQSTTTAGSPAAKVVALGEAKGLRTSKSVGDVSVSIDYNAVAQDLNGWAAWNLTTFGQQFATIAKLMGKGGMMVW